MRRGRRERGTVTVEYVIVTMLVVIPFCAAVLACAGHLIPYFDFVEHLNSLSLP
jgi:hypothetical protein